MELDAVEQRILGCLIEKQRTTPDVYPLSLNALRTACNQSTNRDPVMALDDEQVREACQRLYRKDLARIAAAGSGSRATKYRHLAAEALASTEAELALIAVLLLRGPQTAGELRTRSERLQHFDSVDAVHETLDELGSRGLIQALEREPGRKELRYAHQLGPRDPELAAAAEAIAAARRAELGLAIPGDEEVEVPGPAARVSSAVGTLPGTAAAQPPADAPAGVDVSALLARIEALEARVDDLEELIAS